MSYTVEVPSEYNSDDETLLIPLARRQVRDSLDTEQKIIEIFEKSENERALLQQSKWYCRHKEAILGSVCGIIAVIVMGIWAAKTLPGKLEDIVESSIPSGSGSHTETGSVPINATVLHAICKDFSKALLSRISMSSLPENLIIYPIVEYTALSHVVGQVCTWAVELIGLKSPVLSLHHCKKLTVALHQLKNENDAVENYSRGKKICCQETTTHLRRGISFIIIAAEIVLLFYICFRAMEAALPIAQRFVQAAFNDNLITPPHIIINRTTPADAASTTAFRGIHQIANETLSLIEQEMAPPIKATLEVGVFTGLLTPAITIAGKISLTLRELYRSWRQKEVTEAIEFAEIGGIFEQDV